MTASTPASTSSTRRPRILITRPRVDAEPLAATLAEHGIDSLIEPLMQAEFILQAKGDLAAALSGAQALVATSANGVRAFAAMALRRDVPVCAVGEATAAAARSAGFELVEAGGGDVDALAAMIVARRDPGRGALLHIAGTISAGDLAGALAGAGFDYRRIVLYRMAPAPALSAAVLRALDRRTLSGVALYSPRTARIFADLLTAAAATRACRDLRAYCLSANVAAEAGRLPWAAIVTAARPEQASLVDAIHAQERPPQERRTR